MSSSCTHNMVLWPTNSLDRFGSLGHPSYFQRVSRLGSVTARQSSSECQSNFAALNRGSHLCLAGRPWRWALAHILVMTTFSQCLNGLLSLYRYPTTTSLSAKHQRAVNKDLNDTSNYVQQRCLPVRQWKTDNSVIMLQLQNSKHFQLPLFNWFRRLQFLMTRRHN